LHVGKKHDNFVTQGLWSYSRHPNCISEIMIWWCVYFFSLEYEFFNFWILGVILLTLLMNASTNLTESITLSKYPEYKHY